MATFKSTMAKSRAIKNIVEQHYEEGRQDRCKRWIYRTIIAKQFAISEKTFYRLLNMEEETVKVKDKDKRQLELF